MVIRPDVVEWLYFASGCVVGAIAVFGVSSDPFGFISRLKRFWREMEASPNAGRYAVRSGDVVRYAGDDAKEAKRVLRAYPGSRIYDNGRDRTPRGR